jgi:hypothetical protein
VTMGPRAVSKSSWRKDLEMVLRAGRPANTECRKCSGKVC